MLTCADCQRLLHERLDGATPDRAALEGHLAECPQCAPWHAAAGLLEQGLRLATPPAPPPALADRLVAAVLADRRRRARRRRFVAAAALAAGLLLAALALRLWPRPAGEPVDPPDVADVRPVRPAADAGGSPDPVGPPAPSLRDSVAEAGDAVASLTRKTADETMGPTALLRPMAPWPPLDDEDPLTPALEPPARSLREAGQGVSSGLEPVAASARRAIGLFLSEIPPMGSEAGSDEQRRN
ncbi:MAG TPA: zf-HC2 domain-containing protein [Gemmataceae bacterium]|nr:zf-HC2 domain-containing protein [Gemmataceae bacterium]